MPTGKQMCETIVKAMKLENPDCKVTPKKLRESSENGELWHVFLLYDWAKERLADEETANKN